MLLNYMSSVQHVSTSIQKNWHTLKLTVRGPCLSLHSVIQDVAVPVAMDRTDSIVKNQKTQWAKPLAPELSPSGVLQPVSHTALPTAPKGIQWEEFFSRDFLHFEANVAVIHYFSNPAFWMSNHSHLLGSETALKKKKNTQKPNFLVMESSTLIWWLSALTTNLLCTGSKHQHLKVSFWDTAYLKVIKIHFYS